MYHYRHFSVNLIISRKSASELYLVEPFKVIRTFTVCECASQFFLNTEISVVLELRPISIFQFSEHLSADIIVVLFKAVVRRILSFGNDCKHGAYAFFAKAAVCSVAYHPAYTQIYYVSVR